MGVIRCYLHAVTLTCYFVVIQFEPWRESGSAHVSAVRGEKVDAFFLAFLRMIIPQHILSFYHFIILF